MAIQRTAVQAVLFAAVLCAGFMLVAVESAYARAVTDSDSDGNLRCTLRLADDEIEEGDDTTLRWTSDNADEGRIESDDPDFDDEDIDDDDLENDSIRVSPDEDATYTVIFEDGSREVECELELMVDEDSDDDDDDDSNDDDDLMCSPSRQSVVIGQSAAFTATGGTGRYTWTTPDGTWTGDRFTATRYVPGTISVMVESGNETDTCTMDVVGAAVPAYPPIVPGFPNTGGEGSLTPSLLALILAAIPAAWFGTRAIKGVLKA